MPNIPQLTNQQKQSCEGKISINECIKSLKTFSENNKINKILVDSYNESFDKGIFQNFNPQFTSPLWPLLERSSKPISTQRLILLSSLFLWLLCGVDLFFVPGL